MNLNNVKIKLFVLVFTLSVNGCEKKYNKNFSHVAKNGDVWNKDNDGDGRKEPIFVRSYTKKNGIKVRSHYRAKSKKSKYISRRKK